MDKAIKSMSRGGGGRYCAAVKYHRNTNKDKDLKFYSFPKHEEFEVKHDQYLKAIKRANFVPTDNDRAVPLYKPHASKDSCGYSQPCRRSAGAANTTFVLTNQRNKDYTTSEPDVNLLAGNWASL